MSAPVCECLLYSIAIISEQFVLLDYTSHIEFMIDKRATRVVIHSIFNTQAFGHRNGRKLPPTIYI